MKKEKKELTTVQLRNRWKRLHIGLKVATYVLPFLPPTIVVGVNWKDWFNSGGWSMPFGVITLFIAGLLSAVLILKRDSEILKKVSIVVQAFLVVMLIGLSFMMLGKVMTEIADIFIYTGAGMLGSIATEQVDRSLAIKRYQEYQHLVDKYILDNKAIKKEKLRMKAAQEREEKAKEDGIKIKEEEEKEKNE